MTHGGALCAALARARTSSTSVFADDARFPSRNYATPERLAGLASIPVLVLTGDTDRLVPPAHAQQFHDAIPASQLVTVETTGHIPQEERPDQSALAVREFLYRQIEGSALAPIPEVDCDADARC